MTTMRTILFCLTITAFCRAQNAPRPAPSDGLGQAEDHHKLIDLLSLEWTGTRLPAASLMRISGLKVGQKVNYDILNEASARITSTGLVSAIDYAYNVQPGKPGVVVSFKLSDELPLLPSTIFPTENEELLWSCMQAGDPIFTRELPNTANAMKFYAVNMDRCLGLGSHNGDFHVHATTACDPKGKATKIVFNVIHAGGTTSPQ